MKKLNCIKVIIFRKFFFLIIGAKTIKIKVTIISHSVIRYLGQGLRDAKYVLECLPQWNALQTKSVKT